MIEDAVRKTEEFLRKKLTGGEYLAAHPEALAYRLGHSFRVANIGRQIAEKEGIDADEMTVACLLHDVSYCETFGEDGWIEHGRRAARIARPFLQTLGLPEDRIEDICYGIAIHVDDRADFPGERTPFALTVQDADNLDRFDVYRLHESLCRDGFLAMGPEERETYLSGRLARLRELLSAPTATATAEKLWKERLGFQIVFYEKLLSQLRSGRGLA